MHICPKCGSKSSAEIMYGYPDFKNKKLEKDIQEGKVALGGCVVFDEEEQATRRCNDCGNEFDYVVIRSGGV